MLKCVILAKNYETQIVPPCIDWGGGGRSPSSGAKKNNGISLGEGSGYSKGLNTAKRALMRALVGINPGPVSSSSAPLSCKSF